MVPWLICGIALFVEVNFRGFLLGRLAELESHWRGTDSRQRPALLALAVSSLTFAFDPFMVNTFQHLHWIALWDGLIWGMHLAQNAQPLDHDRGACGRGHHHVQCGESGDRVESHE